MTTPLTMITPPIMTPGTATTQILNVATSQDMFTDSDSDSNLSQIVPCGQGNNVVIPELESYDTSILDPYPIHSDYQLDYDPTPFCYTHMQTCRNVWYNCSYVPIIAPPPLIPPPPITPIHQGQPNNGLKTQLQT